MILTLNEEANIGRTLAKLNWARRILIIDSGSTDRTLQIIRQFSQAEVIRRDFDTAAAQCNFGLSYIESDWVLSLDADYVLSDALVSEICTLQPEEQCLRLLGKFYLPGLRPLAARFVIPTTGGAVPQDERRLCG